MKSINSTDKRTQIVEIATQLAAIKGFNAFSHRELAEHIGIKSSSVHYHFPKKEDIGIAMMDLYLSEVALYLTHIKDEASIKKLQKFCQLFVNTAKSEQRICLAGMLSSDYSTLGETLQSRVKKFFTFVEHWIAEQVLALGKNQTQADEFAKVLMATLEGTLLSARLYNEPERVESAVVYLLKQLH